MSGQSMARHPRKSCRLWLPSLNIRATRHSGQKSRRLLNRSMVLRTTPRCDFEAGAFTAPAFLPIIPLTDNRLRPVNPAWGRGAHAQVAALYGDLLGEPVLTFEMEGLRNGYWHFQRFRSVVRCRGEAGISGRTRSGWHHP